MFGFCDGVVHVGSLCSGFELLPSRDVRDFFYGGYRTWSHVLVEELSRDGRVDLSVC